MWITGVVTSNEALGNLFKELLEERLSSSLTSVSLFGMRIAKGVVYVLVPHVLDDEINGNKPNECDRLTGIPLPPAIQQCYYNKIRKLDRPCATIAVC
jgi:hypothetical protein